METNTDMLRGRVDIFVLKALSVQDGYGYDILNYIHDKTEGHYEMKQSSIYSVLKRLEKQGLIKSYDGDESNGAKRRYYTLTDNGRKMLSDEEKEWEYTRTLLDNLVSDKTFDLNSDTPPFHPSDLRPLTRRASRTGADGEADTEETNDLPTNNTTESVTTVETSSTENIVEETVPPQVVVAETHNVREEPTVTVVNTTVVQTVESTQPEIVSEPVITTPPITETTNTTVRSVVNENPDIFARATVPPIQAEPETPENIYDRIAATTGGGIENVQPVHGANYRQFFGNLFNNNPTPTETPVNTTTAETVNIDCSHINDLRNHLDKEGIKLRAYEPTTSGKGLVKYVLVNKLVRDSMALSYLFLVAMLLIVYLYKPFGVSMTAFFAVLGVLLILPVIATLVWFNAKDKKKKDNINIKIILSTSGIVYLTFFVVNMIINLIIPNGHSLNSIATYAPSIVFLAVPFFGGMFSILYSTKNYHLKSI